MVTRWVFTDLQDPFDIYTVPLNPREMDAVFRERRLSVYGTSAVDGQDLVFEGRAQPKAWSFRGSILDEEHYEKLREWVYDHVQRIQITDHYGRDLIVQLIEFVPVPKRSVGKPWRHEYEIRALLFSVGEPT